jgi:hypothetical protein
MAKMRLLQVTCTVAMLAAAPVLAQNSPQTGDAAPMAAPAGEPSNKMHHHHAGAMHSSKGDRSQDAIVDKLNEQSYQAAQQGQPFSASGSGSGGDAGPASGTDMHAMPAGGGKM